MTIPIKSNMQVQSGVTLSATGTGVIDATAIQGTAISGTTGTGSAVLSASPTFTGTVTLPAVTLTGTQTVGTGASITVSGTGSVEATQLQGVAISATAPSIAGQVLTSTSTSAAAWQTPVTSVATGSNVVWAATRTATTDNGYSTLSVIKQLKAGNLWSLPASWKFSFDFDSGAGYVINAVVYRTLIDSTTIVDSTAVTFGGLSTGNLGPTAGEFFSDAISIQLDTSHDYYIAVYFQSGSGNLFTITSLLPNN